MWFGLEIDVVGLPPLAGQNCQKFFEETHWYPGVTQAEKNSTGPSAGFVSSCNQLWLLRSHNHYNRILLLYVYFQHIYSKRLFYVATWSQSLQVCSQIIFSNSYSQSPHQIQSTGSRLQDPILDPSFLRTKLLYKPMFNIKYKGLEISLQS